MKLKDLLEQRDKHISQWNSIFQRLENGEKFDRRIFSQAIKNLNKIDEQIIKFRFIGFYE